MKEIVQAQPLADSILSVRFNNGETYNIDLKPFIKTGVSSALKDESFFKQVKVEEGYITWPNGYDFCPEFLYQYATEHIV